MNLRSHRRPDGTIRDKAAQERWRKKAGTVFEALQNRYTEGRIERTSLFDNIFETVRSLRPAWGQAEVDSLLTQFGNTRKAFVVDVTCYGIYQLTGRLLENICDQLLDCQQGNEQSCSGALKPTGRAEAQRADGPAGRVAANSGDVEAVSNCGECAPGSTLPETAGANGIGPMATSEAPAPGQAVTLREGLVNTDPPDYTQGSERRGRGRPRTTVDLHPEVEAYLDTVRINGRRATIREFCLVSDFADDTVLGAWRRGDTKRYSEAHAKRFKNTLKLSPEQFRAKLALKSQ